MLSVGPSTLSPGSQSHSLSIGSSFRIRRGGRVIFDEESRNPTADGSTDAVDRTMANQPRRIVRPRAKAENERTPMQPARTTLALARCEMTQTPSRRFLMSFRSYK